MGDPANATRLLQDALDEEDAGLAAEAIAQGADVNALWEDQTLLSAAVQIGNVELVRLLLAAGADPALYSGMLPSALDVARQHANPELLKCIEEALRSESTDQRGEVREGRLSSVRKRRHRR